MTQTQQPNYSADGANRTLDFGSILEDLDNFGLTPVQFRVYCNLLRGIDESGKVSKSSESIASVCKLTRITVLRVLVQLERMSIIVCARASGKKTVFHLQPPSSWHCVQPVENKASSRQSKVVSFPMSATCKSNIPVNEINTTLEEQVPFRGTCPPVVAGADLVSEVDLSTADTGNEPEMTLDAKLNAVRQLGCNAGQVWRNGQMEILVDGLFMSGESFMQRKIPSFKQIVQPCQAGLNLCRDAIALIRQKIQISKRHNA